MSVKSTKCKTNATRDGGGGKCNYVVILSMECDQKHPEATGNNDYSI